MVQLIKLATGNTMMPYAAFLLIFVTISDLKTTNCKDQSIVHVGDSMTVYGRVKKTVDEHNTYDAFFSIPYAQPPVGELRFRAPLQLPKLEIPRVINSSTHSCTCPQQTRAEGGCEDCLYLNIYKPHYGTNFKLFPVMVWIHGGSYLKGNNSESSFGPDFLLNQSVMVVTINYRLGVFGFLSTEDDSSPGNYGIKDQVLALKWIHENIIYFGGNPNQITLFGESAGASSVSYLSQFPVTKGLFHGAIMESGTTLCSWALQKHALHIATALAKLLNVNTTTTKSMVHGLRQFDYRILQDAQQLVVYWGIMQYNIPNNLIFSPVIEPSNADAIITTGSLDLLRNGEYHKIPYLLGYNALEINGPSITTAIGPVSLYVTKYNFQPEKMVPDSLHIQDPGTEKYLIDLVRNFYFPNALTITSEKQMRRFLSETMFERGVTKSAQLYAKSAPVYFYVFSYAGMLGSDNRQEVGHTEELPYLWKMIKKHNTPTKQDIKTRHRMVKMWTNFAKFGNPTPFKDSLLNNVIWPQVGIGNDFGYLNITRVLQVSKNPNWNSFTFWNNLFEEYQNPPYLTY